MKQGERTMAKEEVAPANVNNDIERAMAVPLAQPETKKSKIPTAEEILSEQERLMRESEARKPREEARAKEIRKSIQDSDQLELTPKSESAPKLPSRMEFVNRLVQQTQSSPQGRNFINSLPGRDTEFREFLEFCINLRDGVRIKKEVLGELSQMGIIKKIINFKRYLKLRETLKAINTGIDRELVYPMAGKIEKMSSGDYLMYGPKGQPSLGGYINPKTKRRVSPEVAERFPPNWKGTTYYETMTNETIDRWNPNRGFELGRVVDEINDWWNKNEEIREQKEKEYREGEGQINDEANKIAKERELEEMRELAEIQQ